MSDEISQLGFNLSTHKLPLGMINILFTIIFLQPKSQGAQKLNIDRIPDDARENLKGILPRKSRFSPPGIRADILPSRVSFAPRALD